MAQTIVGLFDTYAEAQDAVRRLVDRGVSRDDISVVANQASTGYTGAEDFSAGHGSEAADAAGRDATKGTVAGGLVGLLVGMGFLAVPGVGPLLAAGPILSALTGAGIGAAAGGLIGALTHAGVPKDRAQYYAEGVRRGGTVVTVTTHSEAEAGIADAVLNGPGVVDIDQRADYYREGGYAGYSEAAPAFAAADIDQERQRVRLYEEQLGFRKQTVQAGEVTLHKDVITETQTLDVPVTRDEVVIERHAVNRPAVNADFREQTITVPVSEERVTVEKTAHVAEEITLGKREVTETQRLTDTVRREEAHIENPENVDVLERDTDRA